MLTDNAQKELDNIIASISGDTISNFVLKKRFLDRKGIDIPFKRWSTLNQMNVFRTNPEVDFRGFRQWNDVGRRVVKGAKCAFILFPMMRKEIDKKTGEEKEVLSGFRCSPVFHSSQTEGAPLPYEDMLKEAVDVEKLPLVEVATHLGVKVSVGVTKSCYGFFNPNDKRIVIGTDSMTTWFHELAHAVDGELPGKSDDYNFNEVIAELTSCLLCKCLKEDIGVDHSNIAYTQAYVKGYAEESKKGHPAFVISKAVTRVSAIFKYIEDFKEVGA